MVRKTGCIDPVASENSNALWRNHLPPVRYTGGMRSVVSILFSDTAPPNPR